MSSLPPPFASPTGYHYITFPRQVRIGNWAGHIPFAMYLVGALRPRIFVELGTHYGDSYLAFCQAVQVLSLPTKCHAVDTWRGDDDAGHYGADVLAALRAVHDPNYSSFSTLHQMTFDDALNRFADESIDLLHIDGLHTYEAVRHDFETYMPKLSQRAIVLFHDVAVSDFGVHRYWQELKSRYKTFDFAHSHGLGVLAFGKEIAEEIAPLFNSDATTAAATRTYFHRLGDLVVEDFQRRQHFQAEIVAQHDAVRKYAAETEKAIALLSDREQQLNVLTQRVGDQEKTLRTYANELEKCIAVLAQREQEIAHLSSFGAATNKAADEQRAELQKNLASLQADLVAARAENESLSRALAAARDIAALQRQQAEATQERNVSLETQYRHAESLLATAQQSLAARESELRTLQASVRDIENVAEQRRLTLARLQGEADDMRRSHAEKYHLLAAEGERETQRLRDRIEAVETLHELRKNYLQRFVHLRLSEAYRNVTPRTHSFYADHLVPIHELVPGNGQHEWQSLGVDPQFLIPCQLPQGWLYVRIEIESDTARSPITIYFDHGEGVDGRTECVLGHTREGVITIDTHIRLARPTTAIRFDPVAAIAKIKILNMHIQFLPQWRYKLRALRGAVRKSRRRGSYFRQLQIAASIFRQHGWRGLTAKVNALGVPAHDAHGAGYQRWLELNTPSPQQLLAWRDRSAAFAARPLISVLLPTYNTPPQYLRHTLDSVLAQVYDNWELCIADDCSPEPHVVEILNEYAARDRRIKVKRCAANGGIAAATNSALELATGEFVALLDHDDVLAPHAFYRVAEALQSNPSLDFIYTDEDRMGTNGERAFPFFKPAYSPEYLLSLNYITHLAVLRTGIVRKVGGFRSRCDTAQDYDLFLRISREVPPERVHHIPDILYHWRMLPTSASGNERQFPKLQAASVAALQDHLNAAYPELSPRIDPGPQITWHRPRFTPKTPPLISIIIPSQCKLADVNVNGTVHQRFHLEHAVNSILETSSYKNIEILAVDRHEMPADLEARLSSRGVRRITYNFPFNWSRVNNHAAAQARGQYYLFLNDDVEVITPDWLESLLDYALLPGVGAVGAKLLYPSRTIQHAGVVICNTLPYHAYYGCDENHSDYAHSTLVPRNFLVVTGACLLTPARVFNDPAIRGFDESFAYAYNDVDYCLKLHMAKFRAVLNPNARLFHFESQSRDKQVTPQEVELLLSRWAGKVKNDPYYNLNLSRHSFDFRVD